MTDLREIIESPIGQGEDEAVSYTLTTTPWGSNPTAVEVEVYQLVNRQWVDAKATVMPSGGPTVAGDVITLPQLKNLALGETYRVEIKFTCSGNVFEAWTTILGEK